MWTRGEGAALKGTRDKSTATETEHQDGQVTRVALVNLTWSREMFRVGSWVYLVVVTIHKLVIVASL
jgi:hypothetical protein